MTRESTTRLLAACLSSLAWIVMSWATPAAAREIPANGMTAEEVADWLREAGLPATVKPDPSTPGDQIISSSADGVNFDIYMYACDHGRCPSLQYAAGWSDIKVPPEKIAEWDRTKRYIRAYVGSSGSWWGEYDIDVAPGGTYESLGHSLARWRDMVVEFKTFIGQ